jgi:hypothetical protein
MAFRGRLERWKSDLIDFHQNMSLSSKPTFHPLEVPLSPSLVTAETTITFTAQDPIQAGAHLYNSTKIMAIQWVEICPSRACSSHLIIHHRT